MFTTIKSATILPHWVMQTTFGVRGLLRNRPHSEHLLPRHLKTQEQEMQQYTHEVHFLGIYMNNYYINIYSVSRLTSQEVLVLRLICDWFKQLNTEEQLFWWRLKISVHAVIKSLEPAGLLFRTRTDLVPVLLKNHELQSTGSFKTYQHILAVGSGNVYTQRSVSTPSAMTSQYWW